MEFPWPGLSRPDLNAPERQDHLCTGPASGPIGELQAAAESLDRRLCEQQADPGSLLALGGEKTLPRLGARDALLQARPSILDQDPQALRAPSAVHLDFLVGRGVGGIVEQVDDGLTQATVRRNGRTRLRPSPAQRDPRSGPQRLPAVQNAPEK